MKTFFYTLLIFIGFCGFLLADEIYMNDLRVIKGKIIQVTDKNVEFSQEGKPFLIVPRDQVFKIKYDNGQVIQIAGVKGLDKIFLKDGSVIEGTIVKVTPDVIMYSVANKQEAVVRENVIKIAYADGKVIQISEGQNANEPAIVEKQPEEKPIEPVIRSGGFIDSYIHLGAFGGFSYLYGDLRNKEENAYQDNRSKLGYSPYSDESPYTDHTGLHGGFELDLMFPAIKYPQVRGFSLTGLKLGLKSTYVFSSAEQTLTDDSLPGDNQYYGKLLKYRSVNAGPELNLVYSPRNDFFNMVLQFYLLGGYIHRGELSAVPAFRDAGAAFNESEYTANFTGYSGTIGANVNFVLNGFPLTLGYGVFYSYSKIEFDRSVPVYGGAKKASFDEFGFTFSVGMHLWGAE